MRRPVIALLALTSMVAACGGDDGGVTSTATTATSVATTTTGASTTLPPPVTIPVTTTEATTTTTTPSTTTTFWGVDPGDLFPDVYPGSGDAHGSGCVTGSDTLPDGVWFGFVEAKTGSTLAFDLACFFTGPAGVAAATAAGEVGYDLDFYISNQNPRTYSVVLDQTRTAWRIDSSGGGVAPVAIPASDWPVGGGYVPCPGEYCAVWLYVNGGVATGLVEQYLP